MQRTTSKRAVPVQSKVSATRNFTRKAPPTARPRPRRHPDRGARMMAGASMARTSDGSEVADFAVRYALASDAGTTRGQNQDTCGAYAETPTHVLLIVADGVGGEDGGDVASQ